MRQRVEQNFAFTQTARQIEQLCEQMIKQNAADDDAAGEEPMTQAA
jgi:hypothetical protein